MGNNDCDSCFGNVLLGKPGWLFCWFFFFFTASVRVLFPGHAEHWQEDASLYKRRKPLQVEVVSRHEALCSADVKIFHHTKSSFNTIVSVHLQSTFSSPGVHHYDFLACAVLVHQYLANDVIEKEILLLGTSSLVCAG